MDNIGYLSPFVPPEWIAAHGLRPVWLTLDRSTAHPHEATGRGICPCAGALVANALCGTTPRTLVLTTVCDQMRYASAYLNTRGDMPTFLLNVPSTWQSPQARQLYCEELKRLGRFLAQSGGCEPTSRQLELTIEHYDDQRTAALEAHPRMSARRWAETLVRLRSDATARDRSMFSAYPSSGMANQSAEKWASPRTQRERLPGEGIPMALLGGPLLAEDDSFLELVEEAGGRIVVDASEGGERTLPAPVDRGRLQDNPFDELVRIYFDTIPDLFRRPNTGLYQWLGAHLSTRSVRGIILRRYPFCDLWHAELQRLRQWSDVPVLDIDVATSDKGEGSRTRGRIEAFLEMFR